MQQLSDLEQARDDFSPEEYAETKKDTVDQLNEFSESLNRMKAGNMSLVDELNRIQLAIQAAISDAFQTPEVLRMFAKKQPGQLRDRLAQVQRDEKIGKLSRDVAALETVEILTALRKLGESLKPEEEAYLLANSTASLRQFERVNTELGDGSQVLAAAGSQVQAAAGK
jgi:cysteinyl-tRNA synthetase